MTLLKFKEVLASQNALKSWIVILLGGFLTILQNFGLNLPIEDAAPTIVDTIFSLDLIQIITVTLPLYLTPIFKFLKNGGITLTNIWNSLKKSTNFRFDLFGWLVSILALLGITVEIDPVVALFEALTSITDWSIGGVVAAIAAVSQFVNTVIHLRKPPKASL